MTNNENPRITILGAGAWGATLADLVARTDARTTLWDLHPATLEALRQARHPRGVPELELHPHVHLEADLGAALRETDAAIIVVPSQAVGSLCDRIAALPRADWPAALVLASKGIEIATGRTLSEVVEAHVPIPVAALSGPCIAREVARRNPTSSVVASADAALAERLQRWISLSWFRLYTQDDLRGVELGGALKNVVAIAAGIGDGLGFGANSKAALLCRGIAEMTRLAVALGAKPRTLSGMAGLGDLAVTCYSADSRNRQFGELLARGKTPDEARAHIGMTVEGEPTAAAAVGLAARHGIDAPIMGVVHAICTQKVQPMQALGSLMARSLKAEFPEE